MPLPVFSEHTVRSLATPASFLRGKKYLYDNAVGVVETDGNRYWARVQGSRPYHVTIYQRNGEAHADCTCPYNFGGICKHAVATMLKILQEGPKWAAYLGLSPAEMVKKMTKPELESFVMDLIGLKEGALDLLRFHYLGGTHNASAVDDYLRYVEEVFDDESISIYNTKNVYENLQPLVSFAEKLKEQGNYREAAKAYEALFEGVAKNTHRIEDSYGLFAEIAGNALGNLVDCLILGGIDELERQAYVQKFLKSYTRNRYEFFNDDYRDAILRLASEKDLAAVLTALDRLIGEYACDDEEDEWSLLYYYRHALLFKLDVLERLDRNTEFIHTARANCDISDVCLKLVKKLKGEGRVEEAIEKAEQHAGRFSGEEAESLLRFLAETYVEEGNLDKAIDTYRTLFASLGDFTYYEQLKRLALRAGTWNAVYAGLISARSFGHGSREKALSEIYLREGMYGEAIAVAGGSNDLTVLEMVAEGVKVDRPEEAFELYRRLVDMYLEEHIGRPAYQQAVSFLMRMHDIGLDAQFSAYIETLRNRFWRRRALLDEMRRLSA